MEVRGVAQPRQACAQLGEREGKDALDLGGIDGNTRRPMTLAEELLHDEPAERVPDQDRGRREPVDHRSEVPGHVVDAEVRHRIGTLARLHDRRGLSGPARRPRVVAGVPEQVQPRSPAGRMEPEPVDEDHRRSRCFHDVSF